MLDAEKAAEGVIKSVKDFVARAVDPLDIRLAGLESRIGDSFDAVHKEKVVFDDKLGGIEKRLDATNAAIAGAVEPFGVRLAGLEAKVEEAANTERFRPFLESALDAVRKEGGAVDEKWVEIEKRLESSGAAIADLIDPLELKLAGLDAHVRNVVTTIPADRSDEIAEQVRVAREEIATVGKRIDGLEPRIEGVAKSAIEVVTPISERVIRLETRYEDVKRDAIDAGIAKAINDFSGKEVKPLDEKCGTLESRLDDVAKIAELAVPLTNRFEDLSVRFKEIYAANDALQEQILKSVDVQIVEAVKLLPPPKDGEHGKDGVSAYQIAVNKGFSGSEDEWLGSLRGLSGIKGDAGESIIGPKGDPGKDAEPVDIAAVVKEVVAQIPVPKDGKDGKDAEPISYELVRAEVVKAVAEIPKPKEIPPEVVAGMVNVEVQKAVSELPKAKDGKDGLAGKDAEPVDVEKIIADVVSKMPVPKDGERGPPGESIVGLKGDPGREVPIEVVSALVAGEVAKAIGSIPKPEKARDGEDGRDALHIEVLPTIDTSKSVPRGTFASHNGGLWRAARNTDPGDDLHLCGWQSLVEGFPDIEIDQGDDLRTFTLRAVSSSGRTMEKMFSLPVMIDRGVFKSEAAYVAGDVVSYGGSIWIAQHETKDTPGMSDGFRLAVKKGRDGKDVALLSPKTQQQVRLK